TEIGGVAQSPVEGVSFTQTFDDGDAASRRDTQYFEMLGCRAIYHRGWKAVVYKELLSPPAVDEDAWELYDVEHDPSECHDLARQEPERLREMIDLWWSEAERYKVLPVDNAPFDRIFSESRPGHAEREQYVYWPSTGPVTE